MISKKIKLFNNLKVIAIYVDLWIIYILLEGMKYPVFCIGLTPSNTPKEVLAPGCLWTIANCTL